ncbi:MULTISPECIES: carboxymuconolactone decarboxylase family protein [unclassified Streptomyces]|uniref:carboxymuconolactone decarboxylase family protein n=1 Tax=unclassified Streptomyces TaxID=2593676 RepID=UPI0033CAB54E
MTPRMDNPSLVVPGALQPLLDLSEVIGKVGIPQATLDLVRLRVSEINGRDWTLVDRAGLANGADDRLPLVATWRTETVFTDAERSVLAMAEAVTLLADPEHMASDAVWEECAQHFTEEQLGALLMHVGLVNMWNRVNVASNQAPAVWR